MLALAAPARAQTAQIAGQVTDTSNAAVPGAVVTITNLATGVMRTGVANNEGLYTVPLLPPGQYRVDVQMDGFAPITRDGRDARRRADAPASTSCSRSATARSRSPWPRPPCSKPIAPASARP